MNHWLHGTGGRDHNLCVFGKLEDNGRNHWMLGIRGRNGIHCVLGNGRTLHEPLGAWDWG